MERRENFIYNFMKDKYGIKQQPRPNEQKKQHKTRQQKKLRRMKKELRRKLKKASFENKPDTEIKQIKQEFLKVVRLHNKVRKLELKHKEKKDQTRAQEAFKEDPHKYAKTLLDDQAKQGAPELNKESANEYFRTTYCDTKRQHRYNPLRGIPKADAPRHQFEAKTPSLTELENVILKKRNKSAPGINAISYLVYKKCRKVYL